MRMRAMLTGEDGRPPLVLGALVVEDDKRVRPEPIAADRANALATLARLMNGIGAVRVALLPLEDDAAEPTATAVQVVTREEPGFLEALINDINDQYPFILEPEERATAEDG